MINNKEEARLKVLEVRQNRKDVGKELLKILGLFVIAELITGIFIQTTWNAYKTPLDWANIKSILIHVVIPAGWVTGMFKSIEEISDCGKRIWHDLRDNRKAKNELRKNNYSLKMSYYK